MSDFFDSDIIQEELRNINDLQEEIYSSFMTFGTMDREEKLEHIGLLQKLLEKQQVMYIRVSLSTTLKRLR